MTIHELDELRTRFAANVAAADDACRLNEIKGPIAEATWERACDALYDLNDQIVATPARNITDVAIKVKIWALSRNEICPYPHYLRAIVFDVLALSAADPRPTNL